MAFMSPVDAMFLLMESREHPMHVGALSLFTPPESGDPGFARRMYEDLVNVDEIFPLFRRKPQQLWSSFAPVRWTQDKDIDLEYHVRFSALPRPGRVRELLELTSRLHGTLLDRHRPLWEVHVIEGLADGRVAVYVKTHHALIDGVSASRIWYRALAKEPAGQFVAPWAQRPRRRSRPSPNLEFSPLGMLGSAAHMLRDIAGIAPATLSSAYQAINDDSAAIPFQAPKTMFNVPITGARRFAAQSWPLARVRAVSTSAGVTVNDTMLAMAAGALRRYLLEQDALPDQPLIAMVPVSLRSEEAEGHSGGEGNSVGAVLCNLGTELSDPAARLLRIHNSMRHSKNVLSGLSSLQSLAVSVLNVAGMALGPIPGVDRMTGPPFNVVISNVPGPSSPRYWNGARLENCFPASIPVDGQALNITATSYADTLQFGLVGCRRSVPSLQRMLVHLEESLAELEQATA